MNRGLSVFVRDNLEAFAVAIALALVVRHYSLEAFRIPSKPMMPTLIVSERGGDRILVDKYRWLFGEPHRWEPTVFQYPLNRSHNFIKRLVGLPGERLKIEDGDIWTSRDGGGTWRIERKTADAREALFFPFYPEPVEEHGAFRGRANWILEPEFRRNYGAERYWWISYFQTFLLQGMLIMIVSLPLSGVSTGSRPGNLNLIDYIGVLVWLAGFASEAGGDFQLSRFKRDAGNKGKVLDTGFWKYTRHPNYFGDSAVWWAFALHSASQPEATGRSPGLSS